MIFSLCSPSPRSDEVTKRMQYTVVLFHHQVKAQLEFAASEEASGASVVSGASSASGVSSASSASGASSGSPSTSNEAYAAPLPLASYTG